MLPRSQLLSRVLLDIPAIPRDDEDKCVADELLDDINAGRARCIAIKVKGNLVGSLVYEIRGVQLIVHAVRCDNIEEDCTARALAVARSLAVAHGCKLIHLDTKRPGLIAKLVELGAVVNSVALRIAV